MTLPEGFVRWPSAADAGWIGGRSIPKGYRLAVVDEMRRPSIGWRRLVRARNCRFTVGPRHKACGRDAVLELARGTRTSRQWWGYCEQHLYGRRWDPPRLLTTVLVEESTAMTGDHA